MPIVQYQLNAQTSNATKQVPYETWMGFTPTVHQPHQESNVPALEDHKCALRDAWRQAVKSIMQARLLWHKSPKFHPY